MYNLISINGDTTELNNYVSEVANKYGYSAREIQEFVEDLYGEENISSYNTTSNQFEPISQSRRNSGQTFTNNTNNERNTIKNGNSENNQRTKELNNSSFSLKKDIIKEVPTTRVQSSEGITSENNISQNG